MKNHLILMILFLAGLLMISCSEESTENDPNNNGTVSIKTITDLDCDTTNGRAGRFTFFSLQDSSVVPASDSATTKWDIAFSSTTIITNSAFRGPGLGGAIVYKLQTGESFAGLTEAPADGYAVDTSLTQKAIRTGSGNGWYLYDSQNSVIRPINDVVLFIRTADGKYAKMMITSYYKGNLANPDQTSLPRFYNFKYAYQPDGSRKF